MYDNYVFSKGWFIKYQSRLLSFANTWIGRKILRIDGKRSSVGKNKITRIGPNFIQWGDTYEFRTHNKFGKRLYHAFKPVWHLFHLWDIAIANNLKPALNLGFDTLTTYPAAGSSSPVDGIVIRQSVDETFGTIRAGAGTTAVDNTDDSSDSPALVSSATSNQFQGMRRNIYLFDTSSILDAASITSAVISVYGNAANTKTNQMGSQNWIWVASTPASNSTLATSDYGQLGTVSFGSITYAAFTGGAYNDTTLNASGLAAINVTGISKFGARLSDDFNNSFSGVWGSALQDGFRPVFADHTGTTQDPKLVVTGNNLLTTTSTTTTTTSTSTSTSSSSSTSTTTSSSSSSSSSSTTSTTTSTSSSTSTSTSTSSTTTSSGAAGESIGLIRGSIFKEMPSGNIYNRS